MANTTPPVGLQARSNHKLGRDLAAEPATEVATRIRDAEKAENHKYCDQCPRNHNLPPKLNAFEKRRVRSAENTLSILGAAFAYREALETSRRKSTVPKSLLFLRSNALLLLGGAEPP